MEPIQFRQWVWAILLASALSLWEALWVLWVMNCGGRPVW